MDRRNFLKKTSLGSIAGLVGVRDAYRIVADRPEFTRRPPPDEVVRCGLIGFGTWGRNIAEQLDDLPEMQLTAICDTYGPMLRRAQRSHPDATRHEDYTELLSNPDIDAILVATPTHQHRQVVIDALSAGKHVYCESPMAHTVEDARAIAQAANEHPDQIFQVGLHLRSEPQYRSVFQFIRSGAIGDAVMARAQWNTKESWRRASPNREREIAQNWRLDPDLSLGLIGEAGLGQIDAVCWMMGGMPTSVAGFGSTLLWTDGRQVPDTEQAVYTFPSGANLMYNATLASSFDAAYENYYGSFSTIMMRDQKGWMFKEVDAPMLGWEVYARKDKFYKETGVALVANATKLDALGQDATDDDPNRKDPIWHGFKAFSDNFFFGPYPAMAGQDLGFAMVVLADATRRAVREGTRIAIADEDYLV
ncbi:MAG: Gfo/Idh/MocA family oxidoreductase [Rhodothermales bacterium]|nr:Gfo/Idh/MocA family oxidoreductase [Rhodothermales bacterium]MBO6779912.1 Gfo/Idh/MocA family oxidoreductase [Rhodothermales bacterium]